MMIAEKQESGIVDLFKMLYHGIYITPVNATFHKVPYVDAWP